MISYTKTEWLALLYFRLSVNRSAETSMRTHNSDPDSSHDGQIFCGDLVPVEPHNFFLCLRPIFYSHQFG